MSSSSEGIVSSCSALLIVGAGVVDEAGSFWSKLYSRWSRCVVL